MTNNISREMVVCVVKMKLNEALNSGLYYVNAIDEAYDLSYQLCLDSMDKLDFIVSLEKVFGIKMTSTDYEALNTVGQVVDYIYNAVQLKEKTSQRNDVNEEIQNKKNSFSFFTKWLLEQKKKKEKKLSLQDIKKSDKDYNEWIVLQFLLFQTVDIDALDRFIKSTFGAEIPKIKLENVMSVEALFNLVKQYKGKHKQTYNK